MVKEFYPDPTADEGDWSCVDLAPEKALAKPVTLAQIKADNILKEMVLAKQSRLSVSPVTTAQFERLLKLAENECFDSRAKILFDLPRRLLLNSACSQFNHNSKIHMNEPTLTQIKDTTANPAPLGLLGFGMTTVLLNLHNAGFYELNSMVLAMGICYGGIAQIIAGIMEWKKGNTFATTAFISYGFFWLSLVALVLLPKIIPGTIARE